MANFVSENIDVHKRIESRPKYHFFWLTFCVNFCTETLQSELIVCPRSKGKILMTPGHWACLSASLLILA